MLIIGSHVSFSNKEQLYGSVKEALLYNSNALMLYTGSPQNTNRCAIDYDLTVKGVDLLYKNNISLNNIVVHAPYIINLANNQNEKMYKFSINFLKQEIRRTAMIGSNKLVLHPGCFVKLDIDTGINNIINALNEIIDPRDEVSICLETMAGKGTEIGFKLEHLKRIIDGVRCPDKLKVCLDTCHLNDAGYDMASFDSFLDFFDKMIGINKIACVHINDSKNELGSKKDRHENIGFGTIGFDNLINIIYNKRLEDVPKILETPYIKHDNESLSPYKYEIDMIRNRVFNENLYDDIIKRL